MQILCIDSTLAFHEFGRQTVFDHTSRAVKRVLNIVESKGDFIRPRRDGWVG
jgi:hypothetical protein